MLGIEKSLSPPTENHYQKLVVQPFLPFAALRPRRKREDEIGVNLMCRGWWSMGMLVTGRLLGEILCWRLRPAVLNRLSHRGFCMDLDEPCRPLGVGVSCSHAALGSPLKN